MQTITKLQLQMKHTVRQRNSISELLDISSPSSPRRATSAEATRDVQDPPRFEGLGDG